jgi:hypothetical protein
MAPFFVSPDCPQGNLGTFFLRLKKVLTEDFLAQKANPRIGLLPPPCRAVEPEKGFTHLITPYP